MKQKIEKIKWIGKTKTDWELQRNELLGQDNPDLVRFGSSEIATVLGISKWESKLALFHRKRGLYPRNKFSLKMTVGNKIEPLIADIMESWSGDREQLDFDFTNGIKHRKLTNAKFFMTNSDYPFMLASLDYYTTPKYPCVFTGEYPKKGIIWETKNPAYMSYKAYEGVVPDYYNCQVQQQLGVSGFDKGYLAILAGSDYPDLFEIPFNKEYFDFINNQCTEFGLSILKAKLLDKMIVEEMAKSNVDYGYIQELEAMIQQLEPDTDGTEATKEFLEEDMYPESNSLKMIGDESDDTLCERYLKAIKLENKLKETKTHIRNILTKKMQDFEVLKTDSHKVTNRRSKSGRNHFSCK